MLTGLGFETDRLKTGTPARVDSRTVNLASLEAQPGDADVRWFSFDSSVGNLSKLQSLRLLSPLSSVGPDAVVAGTVADREDCSSIRPCAMMLR